MRGLRTERALISSASVAVVVQRILDGSRLISRSITFRAIVLNIAPRLVVEEAILRRLATVFKDNDPFATYQKRCVSPRITTVILLVHPEATGITCNRSGTCGCS